MQKMEQYPYAWYSVLWCLFALIVFSSMWVRHYGFISSGDVFHQNYPIFVYLSQYLKKLLPSLIKGDVQLYDYSLGYGADILYTLSYYGLGDVFAWISALFPASMAEYAYSAAVLIRLYCCGMAFVFYSGYKRYSPAGRVLGALTYTWSFYAIGYSMTAFQMGSVLVWLPLILYGVDHALQGEKRGKWEVIYIAAVFFQSLCGFYFLYIDILGIGIYVLICGSFLPGKVPARELAGRYWRGIWHFLAGMGLSSFLLVPCVTGYFESLRGGQRASVSQILTFDKAELAERLLNLFLPPDSPFDCGLMLPAVVTIPAVLFLLFHAAKYRKQLLCFVIIAAAYLTPLAGYVTNGFAYSVPRWTYLAEFYFAVLIARLCGEGIFDRKRNLTFLLTAGNVLLCGFLLYAPCAVGGRGMGSFYQWIHNPSRQVSDSELYQNKDQRQWFSRMDLNDTALDAPLALGIPSTYLYYSIYNGNIYRIYDELKISPAIIDTFHMEGLDGRQELETLLSVELYGSYDAVDSADESGISDDTNGEDKTGFHVTRNQMVVKPGFLYPCGIKEKLAEDLSPLQKMNLMMNTVILEEDAENESLWELEDQVPFESTESQMDLPCTVSPGKGVKKNGNMLHAAEGSTIHVSFAPSETAPGSEVYVLLGNLTAEPEFETHVDVEGKRIRLMKPDQMWFLHGDHDKLVKLDSGRSRGEFDIRFEKEGDYTLDHIRVISNRVPDLPQQYQRLKKREPVGISFEQNQVRIQTDSDQNAWLFLSLPYSRGWKCDDKGLDAKIYRANYSFMAVPVSPGPHEIVFTYRTPGLGIGCCLSIISILALYGVYIRRLHH